MVKLGDRLTKAVGSKVKVEPRSRGEKGRIVIDYATKEELENLVSVLLA